MQISGVRGGMVMAKIDSCIRLCNKTVASSEKLGGPTKFSKTSGAGITACSPPGKFLNVDVLRCDLVDFQGLINNILTPRTSITYCI